MSELLAIARDLAEALRDLPFGPPVTHVYHPLDYAWRSFESYTRRYGTPPKQAVLVGMNPGPWGMAQTGVPFGEVDHVRSWLGIEEPVDRPPCEHPRRPVLGFACPRSEVSGRRLWSWARETFGTPEAFFARFFIYNYCPLLFLEESGRNRTPDRLPTAQRRPLLAACDRALRATVVHLRPRVVLGVGRFAQNRVRQALEGLEVEVAGVIHPSPANPAANRRWKEQMEEVLRQCGLC